MANALLQDSLSFAAKSGQGFGRAQKFLLVAYAISLPVSLTASWAILIAGLALTAWQIACNKKGALALASELAALPFFWPLVAFIASVFASGLVNGGFAAAVDSLVSLRAMLVFPWAFSQFRSTVSTATCVSPLLVMGALAGICGAGEQLFDFHPFGYKYLQGTGFLGGPMAYAGQMQLFSMLSLGLALGGGRASLPGKMGRPLVLAGLAIANLSGVLFASERSAWLGTMVAAVVLAFAISWRTFCKVSLGLLVVSILCWSTVPVVKTRLAQAEHWQQDVSVQVRLKIWRQSLAIWSGAPLFGVGIRRFPHFDFPNAIVPGRSKDLNHAHSNYLHVLATTGLAGLSTYLVMCFFILRSAWLGLTQAGRYERALSLGIFGGAISLMISGLFEYNFGTAQVRLAQWFILAMLPPLREAADTACVSDEEQDKLPA